jgi:hypothetical protein
MPAETFAHGEGFTERAAIAADQVGPAARSLRAHRRGKYVRSDIATANDQNSPLG